MIYNYSTIDLYAHYNCELSLDYEDKNNYYFNVKILEKQDKS